MTVEPTATVRPVAPGDHDAWADLFRAYRASYEDAGDEALVARVWTWVLDPGHEVGALVAEAAGEVVGIAHHRRFARPAAGSYGTYLDDLFTAPQARGRGVATALIAGVRAVAESRGDTVVRWITRPTNAAARRVYDAVGQATPWLTYDIALPGAVTAAAPPS